MNQTTEFFLYVDICVCVCVCVHFLFFSLGSIFCKWIFIYLISFFDAKYFYLILKLFHFYYKIELQYDNCIKIVPFYFKRNEFLFSILQIFFFSFFFNNLPFKFNFLSFFFVHLHLINYTNHQLLLLDLFCSLFVLHYKKSKQKHSFVLPIR